MSKDRRLIEAGFPCHQVGAETKRERDTGKAPPTHRIHVWWARRPLTPSRAAILASILPADTDSGEFLQELGIERKQIDLDGSPWFLVGKNLDLIQVSHDDKEYIAVDDKFQAALKNEQIRRQKVREKVEDITTYDTAYKNSLILKRWLADNGDISKIVFPYGQKVDVNKRPGDPAFVNELIAFVSLPEIGALFPSPIRLDPEDLYGYGRAYQNKHTFGHSNYTVLDPTAGGGSIPFEAMRLGFCTISNDLNPVATVIQRATLEYPFLYGKDLAKDIGSYGKILEESVNTYMARFTPFSPLNEKEKDDLKKACIHDPFIISQFDGPESDQTGLLNCRMVTCPHCQGQAPLLNSSWLSKSGEKWGLRTITDGKMHHGTVRFEPFRFNGSHGPNGEDPDFATVTRGVGTCIHCKQAISSEEIKNQACGRSALGTWWDELFCIAAVRYQPKVDKKGNIERYKSGEKAGEIKTEKVAFFRAPTEADRSAIIEAQYELERRWDTWDKAGIIPTERFPEGNDMRPVYYGMTRWCDMFTPRQLLGHLTAIETLNSLKPQIIAELGTDKGRAVVTYLQFAIDKCLDYNSRQTRWEYTRGIVKGTFGRHDFSLKWTFGEMIFSGPNSGLAWGLSQILDAYSGIAELVSQRAGSNITILNGTAASMDIFDASVDVICIDPPYYNNVQYAELSDFFYVWQRRTLEDQYPKLFNRRLTNKQDEAVANPVREGSAANADREYERLMTEIFVECRRVLKPEGIMTVMFTHKTQEAWQTLTQALIESGWAITSAFPVDSESAASMHQKDMAAAASSIFIACRPRQENKQSAVWSGFGGIGVAQQVRQAVREGLEEFVPLHLNPIDEMVASYGRALQVLSENWPVLDGDKQVTPIRAMTEASSVVAQYQMTRLTKDRLRFNDLNTEAGFVLTLFGIYGLGSFPFDDALSLAKSLNISLENKSAGYRVGPRMSGINEERSSRAVQNMEDSGYYAPLVRKGSKLRLAAPDERNPRRLKEPQTEWDLLQGIIMAFREGDVPLVRAYVQQHAPHKEQILIDLVTVWADNMMDEKLKKEASRLLYGLKL